ncbi:sigma-E processing peptidase SpoIIGA [Ruminococcus sp.]|uniref:sigma-E processing peptidase SpoIIGA n=1 Tax=Ruminococcus sp. TaxID=41978 RepID=UPI0025EC9BCC|nr:sigma-E processing peptidase SpoIIGA [Ruminococcus sp.]MBQ8965267.1 sigma-E processing peptidase SpoIIGA [Ruminococcus sp.]
MKIYLDVLIVTNCIVELIYLQTTALLTHRRLTSGRLCSACLTGGLLSLLICADGGTFVGALIITIAKLIGIIMTLFIGIKPESPGSFFKTLIVYAAVRIAFAGMMIMYWELSDSKRIYVRNYTTYFDISLLRLSGAVITAYLLLSIYSFIIKRLRDRRTKYEAVFSCGDYEVRLPAVADTGNKLCDSFTGLPVVIFCCNEMHRHYALYDAEAGARYGFRLTPYSTINGSGLIAVTSKGSVTITDDKGNVRKLRCCAGVKECEGQPSIAIFDPDVLE